MIGRRLLKSAFLQSYASSDWEPELLKASGCWSLTAHNPAARNFVDIICRAAYANDAGTANPSPQKNQHPKLAYAYSIL